MKYNLHYNERLRSVKLGSPLFFGKAIDDAIMSLLLTKKADLTVEEKYILTSPSSPEDLFISRMTITDHLGQPLNLQYTTLTEYYKSDIDLDLLQEADLEDIFKVAKAEGMVLNSAQDVDAYMEECYAIMKNKQGLEKDEQLVYNNIAWHSLKRKGLLLIQAFKDQILPEIHTVFSLQEKVTLPDGNDEFIGFIDFVASFTDSPREKYIIDLKTSSRVYPDTSVKESDQLACYSEYKGIRQCAYIVLVKALKKREPRVKTQIVKDTIDEVQVNKTFDKISNVFYGITDGIYEKCYEKGDDSSCFAYGRKCPYYGYCRTGELKNLRDLGAKE
jgi:hypothetical protein